MLSFVYYFYNLMPLSRGSSVVAYTVAMGMFMAIGREVTGKLPHGKVRTIYNSLLSYMECHVLS